MEGVIANDLTAWAASAKLLSQGHTARREGRTDDALRLFGEAVAADAGNAEAQSVFGLMLLRLGHVGAAEEPLRRAVAMTPDNPAFAVNLAEWCWTAGRSAEATSMLNVILARRPDFYWAWERLGDLQTQAGEFEAARESFLRAAQGNPTSPMPLLKLAHADIETGRLEAAKRTIENAAHLGPNGRALYRAQAMYLQRTEDWMALENLSNARIAAEPRDADAWLGLSRSQLEQRKLKPSLASYAHAVRLGGATPTSFVALCMQVNAFAEAEDAIRLAEQQNPDDPGLLRLQSGLLMYKGAYDEAEACCERLLAANPKDCHGYRVLSQLKSGRLPDIQFKKLMALSEDSSVPDADRMLACYAAADCLDASGEFDSAFQKYKEANEITRRIAAERGIRYDRTLREEQIEQLMAYAEVLSPPAAALSTAKLIFIVGMPRSGTTLVESVLGAHSKVLPGGEYHAMRWIMEDVTKLASAVGKSAPDATQWLAWRELYIGGMPATASDQIVTDKHPFNFDAVPVILCLFPNARIVHVRRNPLETCLSIYRNHFDSRHAFASDLRDIGHHYGQYARLVDHWERLFPDRFSTVQYEQFVTQFEKACPALVESCGLEWEPQCLELHQSKRLISTLSTIQARKAPSLNERVQSYHNHLAPLLDALAMQNIDLATRSVADLLGKR